MKLNTKQDWLLTLMVVALFFSLPAKAQVNIGTQDDPKPFSLLELNSSSGGLRLPHLNTTQRDNISDEWKSKPEAYKLEGLVIFNTDTNCLNYWNGNKWVSLCSSVLERSEKPTANLDPFHSGFCENGHSSEADGRGVEGSKITVTWCDGSTDETIVGDNIYPDKSMWVVNLTRINPNYNTYPYYTAPCFIYGAKVEVVQTTPGKLPSEPLIFNIINCAVVY